MKHLSVIILIFATMFAKGQNFTTLEEVSSRDKIKNGKAIIYGSFIQRLGFSSGGYPQDIRLINIDTKEVVTFRVKPTFKSSKENRFAYFIKSGSYAILNYWWTQSKWYGGEMFTEPIYKNVDASDNFKQKIKTGEINSKNLEQFTFTIQDDSLNYLGTWHFDKGLVSFTDDRTQFDNLIKGKFKKLDFSKAKEVIPK